MPDTHDAADDPLSRRLRAHPRVADPGRARWRLADLAAGLDPALRTMLEAPDVHALVAGIADHSPYLWRLIEADPARLAHILSAPPNRCLLAVLDDMHAACASAESDAAIMRHLRLARQAVALLVALADLGGAWTLEDVMQALSRAADALIGAALAYLLRQAHAAGRLRLADVSRSEEGCGLAVLGLGKLGGRELNYSSDVDLIVVFDPDCPALVDPDNAKTLFVRVVRDLVRLLQEATADGFVHRVDLRLRPDPGATAVAISLPAAFLYYERFGQNWERAAMIKARMVAGDPTLGQTFLAGMAPFVWRKYFDFAAIADIHAMKRQIHAVKGGGEIAVAGHNVKLGRGGIREIEFFVQTQQLIFGGKRPDLRGSRTVAMLRQLRSDGWIGAHAVTDLTRAYEFLRRTEHRLQMLGDEQTHRLPRTPEALERFARFCGFVSAARFSAAFTRHLGCVVHHYGRLFEHAPGLDDAGGSLVFTGVADDPDTLETLADLGYKAPGTVSLTVRAWHSGRRVAVQTSRARETLTDLVPKLLVTFARTSDPDAAIAAFDAALERMPAAGELFAILAANASLRALFGDILGSAPCLAAAVTMRPHLLDAAIDPAAAVSLDETVMQQRAASVLARATTTEGFLDAIRDYQHEEHFLIGVRLLSGDLDPEDAGAAYSALAVGIIRAVLSNLTALFSAEHGRLHGSAVAVVAMGKLGSLEMTATSDLDLVLIYEFDPAHAESDGAKPLHATAYFARLTQRLVSHLSVATRRGGLYDVDMRLRPSGHQGPLATKLSAFKAYQRTSAQTWEHMALTRARVIAGDQPFGDRVGREIETILRLPPNGRLRRDVAEMRGLVEREKPATTDWDLKLMTGGLVDIEFIAQYLVLREAGERPAICDTSTRGILRNAVALRRLAPEFGDLLIAAHRLYTNTTQIMRLALPEASTPDTAGEGVRLRLAAAVGLPDFARLTDEIATARKRVRATFQSVLIGA